MLSSKRDGIVFRTAKALHRLLVLMNDAAAYHVFRVALQIGKYGSSAISMLHSPHLDHVVFPSGDSVAVHIPQSFNRRSVPIQRQAGVL